MVAYLFVWHGIVQALIVPQMVEAVLAQVISVLRPLIVGQITAILIKRDVCYGQLNKNMAISISWADLMILAGNVALGVYGL
jgi:hypothetical protein